MLTDETEIGETEETLTEAEIAAEEFYRQTEPSAPNELREAALKRLDTVFFKGLRLVSDYDGSTLMAFDCFLMALGKGDMIRVPSSANPKGKPVTAVMIAKKHFADTNDGNDGKATITKCVKYFQDNLNLPPMPGQRPEESRKAMGESRIKQLKK